jgi:ABC-type Fe3+ transport system substrate-binding protein
MKFVLILVIATVIALPFLFTRDVTQDSWRPGDPELIIVTPHNEAIRQEFALAFSAWHQEKYGQPVRIDWRVLGGTTEIMRYLAAEYARSAKHYFKRESTIWPANGQEVILATHPPTTPADLQLWQRFRACDRPDDISCGMDLFFGGGPFDHSKAQRQGLTVPAWGTNAPPLGLFVDHANRVLIPDGLHGEVWRGHAFYGTALSAFGICYNKDRLRDLGITHPPRRWEDLSDPKYCGQLALADPTKSGSIAKAFEMIIQATCMESLLTAGFTQDHVDQYELALSDIHSQPGTTNPYLPANYQATLEQGWCKGIALIRRLSANARYFSDSASKIPVDVSMGVAAAGVTIDFMGRFQSEMSTPAGKEPAVCYVNPEAGSSVNADPISLLRGAPHRELAVRFIEYVLSADGQKLWNYRPGTPGGPKRFALRRLPIRRAFYPSTDPVLQRAFEAHQPYLSDELGNPENDAYRLAQSFHYIPRWTAQHFGVQRDLIRAMCMDSGDELKSAWRAILAHGGPEANPKAMALLEAMPDTPYPLTWKSAITDYASVPRADILRTWTAFFRTQYRLAEEEAKRNTPIIKKT